MQACACPFLRARFLSLCLSCVLTTICPRCQLPMAQRRSRWFGFSIASSMASGMPGWPVGRRTWSSGAGAAKKHPEDFLFLEAEQLCRG